jgi:ElaB/YqjD/DUF883 family membrane-anchored ribosome-binding protein
MLAGSFTSRIFTTRIGDHPCCIMPLSPLEKTMDSITHPRAHTPSSTTGMTDRLVGDFQTFVGDVEQLLKSAAQLPGDTLAAARGKLEERVTQAKARLADAGSAAANAASQARDRSESYIREQPWTALGLAAAAGVAVGAFLFRRW